MAEMNIQYRTDVYHRAHQEWAHGKPITLDRVAAAHARKTAENYANEAGMKWDWLNRKYVSYAPAGRFANVLTMIYVTIAED